MDVPSWSPFPELLDHAYKTKLHFAIHDYSDQKSLVSAQLLHSVLAARNHLRQELDPETLAKLQRDDEDVFIFVLSQPGWEFTVYMLAILALGAAIAPLSIIVPPAESRHCINLANGSKLLFSKSLSEVAAAIKKDIDENDIPLSYHMQYVEMNGQVPTDMPGISYSDIQTQPHPRPNRASSLLFTSGSSMKPKAVVHSYNAHIAAAMLRIAEWDLDKTDVFLNQKIPNWIGGFNCLLPCLISGTEIEFCSTVFNPQWFWDRVKSGDVSVVNLYPETWQQLAEHYEANIFQLLEVEQQSYLEGMKNLKWALASAAPMPDHVQHMWTLLRGKPLLNWYGCTECSPISQTYWHSTPGNCSVGTPPPGAELKIIDGELRVRAPWMFSHYISEDIELNKKSFDSGGFFKTGDCAEIINGDLVVYGRANIDTIQFCNWKIYTLAVENALHSLPYISTAIVFGIPDDTYHERVTAILSFRPSSLIPSAPTIKQLHQDLTAKTNIPKFQFPTVVYWLREGEKVPQTATGKISKLKAKEVISEQREIGWALVEVLDIEAGGNPWDTTGEKWKAWDWGGAA